MNKNINVDLDSIVREAVSKTVVASGLSEAYVAEPKQFKQLSDSVSSKSKEAHAALYKGYVESLNKVSSELDAVERDQANPRHSQFRTLKLDEAYNANAVYLHELHFSNCFDPGSQVYMDSMPYIRLQRDFGTFDDWQHDFIACALSANQGWAVCGYSAYLKRFVNAVIDLHSQNVMVGFFPVIVLDVWDHASYTDYPNKKQDYVVKMMEELNWKVIDDRFQKVEKLIEALR